MQKAGKPYAEIPYTLASSRFFSFVAGALIRLVTPSALADNSFTTAAPLPSKRTSPRRQMLGRHAWFGLLLALMVSGNHAFCENAGPSLQWERVIDKLTPEGTRSVFETNDGGYVAGGWSRSFQADGVNLADLDYYLLKLDCDGNLLWEKRFGTRFLDENAYGLEQTQDGGFVFLGGAKSLTDPEGSFEIQLVKRDSSGNALWTRSHGAPGSQWPYSFKLTADGGFIIAAKTTGPTDTGARYTYLLRTDSEGMPLWERTLDAEDPTAAGAVTETLDGGYLIAVWRSESSYLLWTDPAGNLFREKTLGDRYIRSLLVTTDSGIVAGGNVLLKMDGSGNVIWEKDLGTITLRATPDGFLITNNSVWKTDEAGNLLWEWTPKGPYGFVSVGDAQSLSQGGYIVVGGTEAVPPCTKYDPYLAKLDVEPMLADCNENGNPDGIDIESGQSQDRDQTGIPDECELDCNQNGASDRLDISSSDSRDCNDNGVPDECDIAQGSADCNQNGVPDDCDLPPIFSFDKNPTVSLSVRQGPNDVKAADLNGDGHLDLAVANFDARKVSVLRGDGTMTFSQPADYAFPGRPFALVAVDLDEDGKIDLATSNSSLHGVAVLYNKGDGSFENAAEFALPQQGFGITTGDFDRDGLPDLAATGGERAAWVLRNRGDRTFAVSAPLAVGTAPNLILASDLDGDGASDLVTTNNFNPGVSVLWNRGNGSFLAPQDLNPCGPSSGLAAADLDADGDLEVIGTGFENYGIWILSRTEGRTLEPTGYVYTDMRGLRYVTVADLDGDGDADIAADGPSNKITVFLNTGGGAFEYATELSSANDLAGMAAADFDEDGLLDLAVTNYGSSTVSILRNKTALRDRNGNTIPDECEGGLQLPGDCNQDGGIDLSDAVCTFGVLFLGRPPRFPCGEGSPRDAGNVALIDWQPDGGIDLSDGVGLLQFLFRGGPPHPLALAGSETKACVRMHGCTDASACRD